MVPMQAQHWQLWKQRFANKVGYLTCIISQGIAVRHLNYKTQWRIGFAQVAEWLKALVLKTSVRESVPWVRIPPCPPFSLGSDPETWVTVCT